MKIMIHLERNKQRTEREGEHGGGVTLVPAGCRSHGHCRGNHSHQPDGVSVGDHGKDGSGVVLPGPAGPKLKSDPIG